MPTQWVIADDRRLLELVATRSPDSGVLLAGPMGVGKTTLAAAATRIDGPTGWVAGAESTRPVPLGAFAHLINLTGEMSATAMLQAALTSLQGPNGERPLLVVDDAHDLDRLSATLVHQLVLTRTARLLVTVDSESVLPEAIASLVSDGLLERLDIAPLDRDRTAVVLASAAADAVDPATADALFSAGGGNPLYLRLQLELHQGRGAAPEPNTDLNTLGTRYLAGLPEPVRAVLGLLAVQEPLSKSDLAALTSTEALTQAEAAGAVAVTDDGRVRPASPLYAARARAALTAEELGALRTSLVANLPAASDVVGQLRRAVLDCDSDARQPTEDLVAASAIALRIGELELGERLARAELQRCGSLPARLMVAQALAWQGRGREAEDVLTQLDATTLSESELMAWALPRAANQFWMLSQPAQAAAFLQTTRDRVVAPIGRATLDALAATFAMNAGSPVRALRLAEEVLASEHADGAAVGWAASAAALCSARTGRFDAVEALAARALAGERPGLLRFTSGLGRITVLVMAGRVDLARSLAERYTDEFQQPGRAIGELLVGYVAIAQGDFAAAVPMLERSAGALARTGYSWGPLATTLLAQALGQQGERIDAAKVLSRAKSAHGMKSALFTPELALAEAWTKAARGDSHGAVDAARDAVQAAERGGQSAVALRALQDSARLGDTRAVFRAERLAGEVDCVLGRVTLAHTRALAQADGAGLAEVAGELAALGLAPAAADAAAQARGAGGQDVK